MFDKARADLLARTPAEQGMLGAAIVAALSLFLPWIKISAGIFGSITVAPISSYRGWMILIGLAATTTLMWLGRRTGALVAAIATGALVAMFSIDLHGAGAIGLSGAGVSYHIGWYLALLSVVALIALAAQNRRTASRAVERPAEALNL